jgi:hypothetical protein
LYSKLEYIASDLFRSSVAERVNLEGEKEKPQRHKEHKGLSGSNLPVCSLRRRRRNQKDG